MSNAGCTKKSRLATEVSEIGVESLGTSYGEEDEPHDDEPDKAMVQNKLDPVQGIER
jgi:hypothetical protein